MFAMNEGGVADPLTAEFISKEIQKRQVRKPTERRRNRACTTEYSSGNAHHARDELQCSQHQSPSCAAYTKPCEISSSRSYQSSYPAT